MTKADGNLSTVERALQLARAGDCASIGHIRRALQAEGYAGVQENTAGLSIQAQLKTMIAEARKRGKA